MELIITNILLAFKSTSVLDLIYISLSFSLCYISIPIIIEKAYDFGLVDQPNSRSAHKQVTPSFGGLAIFAAVSVAWAVPAVIEFDLQILCIYITCTALLFVAFLDDLYDLSPKIRFLAQLLAGLAIANAGIRIESLHGLFGVYELPVVIQYGLTVLILSGFTNAFNFIDGIDGLAGGLGAINITILGFVLMVLNMPQYALLAFILAAALLAFLKYNFNPAKIFMGDTGSVFIGFIMATLALLAFKNIETASTALVPYVFAAIITTLFIPVFDIFRTIFFRVLSGNSPLKADKSHIHHLLLKIGLNHKSASITIYVFNLLLLVFSFVAFAYSSTEKALALMLAICFLATLSISIIRWNSLRKRSTKINSEIEQLSRHNKFLYRMM